MDLPCAMEAGMGSDGAARQLRSFSAIGASDRDMAAAEDPGEDTRPIGP
jgi:hypothetical protein